MKKRSTKRSQDDVEVVCVVMSRDSEGGKGARQFHVGKVRYGDIPNHRADSRAQQQRHAYLLMRVMRDVQLVTATTGEVVTDRHATAAALKLQGGVKPDPVWVILMRCSFTMPELVAQPPTPPVVKTMLFSSGRRRPSAVRYQQATAN
ncbi:MAG: hypothetical protein HYT15_02505 [Candidatus Magasanikbacteria bacterium]|nr:hypothetical protein [Candidatus Magasanikbacteria bacterium]